MRDDLIPLIIEALQGLNGQQGISLPDELCSQLELFGRNGILDSLALVTLIVTLEQRIEDKYGVSISLADEKAMSQTSSPFRTIASLAHYASRAIDDEATSG